MNVSGNVRVLALGEGTLHVRSVSGDVAVGVVKGVDLHVDVETASGMVHSDIALTACAGPGCRTPRGPGGPERRAASRATSRSGGRSSTSPDAAHPHPYRGRAHGIHLSADWPPVHRTPCAMPLFRPVMVLVAWCWPVPLRWGPAPARRRSRDHRPADVALAPLRRPRTHGGVGADRGPGGPYLYDSQGRVVFFHGVDAVYKYAPI